MKKLGEGSYGTVFLAIDTRPGDIKRKVDQKYLNLLDKIDDNKGESKSVYSGHRGYDEDVEMSEEQKEAVKVLANKSLIFN